MPPKPFTTKKFIEISNKKHNYKYNYNKSNYINSRTKLDIVCPEHGNFKIIPASHMSGAGCSLCRDKKNSIDNTLTQEQFLQKAIDIHGNKYDYSQTIYTNTRSKLNIICKKHGLFSQTGNIHLRGGGCRKCGIEQRKNNCIRVGYSKNTWIKFCKDKIAYLYLIEMSNETEKFYKIGISSNPTNRFSSLSCYYEIKKILMIPSKEAGKIFDSENKIQKELKNFKYNPINSFPGCTECFQYDNNVYNSFLNLIHEYSNCDDICFIRDSKLSKATNSRSKK